MNLIHVIPISRGTLLDRLSYFTSQPITVGNIVRVPVRKKTTHAIVVGIESVGDAKALIKSSSFALKKVEHTDTKYFFSKEFIESVELTANYTASSSGSVLGSLVPKRFLLSISEVADTIPESQPERSSAPLKEHAVLQAEDEERFAHYKSLIREEFAQRASVYMCMPTIEDIKKARAVLEKGIEQYTHIFHSSLSKKEFLENIKKLNTETHPVLIIATGQYACLITKHIGTIIVERESSRAYKIPVRPYVDIRNFLAIYAKKIGARLLLGDMLLRVETLWGVYNDRYTEFSPLKFRTATSATPLIIDTKKGDDIKENNFTIISKELKELIMWNKERNEHLFIFAVRKGLAPQTLCGDCGTIATCTLCSSPIILHDDPKEPYFRCGTCGKRRSAKETCVHCNSWKLTTLGMGVERIEKEIKTLYPDVRVLRMDAHNTTTHKKALDTITTFYDTPGSILIGTEMALLYLSEKVENTAIASIDPLFSLPDFRIQEKMLSIMLRIRSLAQEHFVIQTRNPANRIFDHATKGNLVDFYREEIEERKKFGYPPFSTFIKITLQGEKHAVETALRKLPALFAPYDTDIYDAFTSKVKGRHVMHALIKLPQGAWVDPQLLATLRSLPPQYAIQVDPESIL